MVLEDREEGLEGSGFIIRDNASDLEADRHEFPKWFAEQCGVGFFPCQCGANFDGRLDVTGSLVDVLEAGFPVLPGHINGAGFLLWEDGLAEDLPAGREYESDISGRECIEPAEPRWILGAVLVLRLGLRGGPTVLVRRLLEACERYFLSLISTDYLEEGRPRHFTCEVRDYILPPGHREWGSGWKVSCGRRVLAVARLLCIRP